MQHSYIVTDSIERVRGLPNIRDHNLAIYFRPQGESLIIGGYERNPTVLDNIPEEFDFKLYDMNWSTFEPIMKNAMKILPSLKSIGIKSTICGPEAFSIDRKVIRRRCHKHY